MKLVLILLLSFTVLGFRPLPEGYAKLKRAERAFLNPGAIILFDSKPTTDQFKSYWQFLEKVKDQNYEGADKVLINHRSLITNLNRSLLYSYLGQNQNAVSILGKTLENSKNSSIFALAVYAKQNDLTRLLKNLMGLVRSADLKNYLQYLLYDKRDRDRLTHLYRWSKHKSPLYEVALLQDIFNHYEIKIAKEGYQKQSPYRALQYANAAIQLNDDATAIFHLKKTLKHPKATKDIGVRYFALLKKNSKIKEMITYLESLPASKRVVKLLEKARADLKKQENPNKIKAIILDQK